MKTGIEAPGGEKNIFSVRMKHPGGFHVDVTQVDSLPRDMMTIRMNVDNIEEACAFLSERGFTNAQGDNSLTDTGTSRATMMVSPSGFSIGVAQHIKD